MQTNLLDQLHSKHDLMSKFMSYHRENRHVFEAFCEKALQVIAKGRTHYGAKTIMEVLRFDTDVRGGDEFKLNNNYAAFYARLFEFRFPQHKDFFRKRKSEADKCNL